MKSASFSYAFFSPSPTQKKFSGSSPSFKTWGYSMMIQMSPKKPRSCLKAEALCVIETVGNLLSHGGLLRVGLGPNPDINDAPLVFGVKRHLLIKVTRV